jgi:hypothetical protein
MATTTNNKQNNEHNPPPPSVQWSAPTLTAAHHPTLESLILDQKVTLRAPLEARHRRDCPLLLCQGPPLRRDPVPPPACGPL